MPIHPSAVVASEAIAHIDPSAEVGPFCIIGPQVRIGPGTTVLGHAVIDGDTIIGAHNTIYPFASLGLAPQDLKYRGEPSRLTIGDHNVFREGCTVHRGTAGGGLLTSIGNHNLFMAQSHVAHDCHVRDHIIMANCSALAGHIVVEDYAVLGGLSGVHQFCAIGYGAFLSGGAKATQDVPPYCTVQGDRARIVGPNLVGLRRRGWSSAEITAFKELFRFFFFSPETMVNRIAQARERWPDDAHIAYFLDFAARSQRGLCAQVRQ